MFLSAEPIVISNSTDPIMNADGTLGYFNMDISISVKVIDTDFEETIGATSIVDAIIDVYEKRNISPVHALIKSFNNPFSINNHRDNPKIAKYLVDIDKMLVLA